MFTFSTGWRHNTFGPWGIFAQKVSYFTRIISKYLAFHLTGSPICNISYLQVISQVENEIFPITAFCATWFWWCFLYIVCSFVIWYRLQKVLFGLLSCELFFPKLIFCLGQENKTQGNSSNGTEMRAKGKLKLLLACKATYQIAQISQIW